MPIEVLSETHRETFTQRRVRLEVAPGQRIEGWLLVPDNAPPRAPAVLVPFYEPETSVGLGQRPQRDFARQLTRAGFVTLSIGTPAGDARTPDRGVVTAQPLSYYAYVAANAWTALAALPYVDPMRIGVVGHSYGGKWALFAGALWDRFAAVAVERPGHRLRRDAPQRELLGTVVPRLRPAGAAPGPGPARRRQPAHRPVQGDARARDGPARTACAASPRGRSSSAAAPRIRSSAGWPLNHTVAVNLVLGFRNRVGMSTRPTHDPTPESNAQIVAFFVHFLQR